MGLLKSDTTERLHFTFHFHTLEKEMATHSSVLAWRIPGTGEPGGLQSMGLHTQWRAPDLGLEPGLWPCGSLVGAGGCG